MLNLLRQCVRLRLMKRRQMLLKFSVVHLWTYVMRLLGLVETWMVECIDLKAMRVVVVLNFVIEEALYVSGLANMPECYRLNVTLLVLVSAGV